MGRQQQLLSVGDWRKCRTEINSGKQYFVSRPTKFKMSLDSIEHVIDDRLGLSERRRIWCPPPIENRRWVERHVTDSSIGALSVRDVDRTAFHRNHGRMTCR